jgi:hypothetical protein
MPAGPRGRKTPPRACEVWREQVTRHAGYVRAARFNFEGCPARQPRRIVSREPLAQTVEQLTFSPRIAREPLGKLRTCRGVSDSTPALTSAEHSKGFVDSVLAGFRGPHRDCEPRLVAGTVEGTPGTLRSVASLFANE